MHTVIFTGGDFPDPESEQTYFSSAPYAGGQGAFLPGCTIAADSGLTACELYRSFYGDSFYPSKILGDMDSISDKNILRKYPEKLIEKFIEDKDYTDTELALSEAKKCGSDNDFVTLVGAGGGSRIDHLLGVFDLFSTELHPDVWLAGTQSLWYAPQKTSFEVRGLALHDMISIARTTSCRTGGEVVSKGLKWEYSSFRKEGMPSLSNRISPDCFEKGDPVEITVESGNFVLIVPASASVLRRKS